MAPSGSRSGARRPAANPPVHRTGAYQYQPPLAAPTAPTDNVVREQRRTAFRNQVRYPHALVDATINRHLNQYNWDVNRAVQSFWESEETALAAGQARAPTVELGRLHALHDMQTSLGNNRNEELRANNAVMLLLYHKKGWDFDATVKEVSGRNGLYDDIVDELARLRLPVDGDVTRDERLARFIDITSTNSWFSARQFLEACGWDLAKAIDAWFRFGGLPIVYPPKPRGTDAVRESGLRDVDVNRPFRAVRGELQQFELEQGDFNDQMSADTIIFNRPTSEVNTDPEIPWAHIEELPEELRTLARTAPGFDPELVPGRDYLPSTGDNRGGRGFPTAAIINRDRSAPVIHCPDATKLYVEYIRKGRYHCQWFEGNRDGVQFGWDEGANPLEEGLTDFDWHNLSHIQRLTRWRNNLLLELTGELVRERVGDKLNKYENDWLREQEAIRVETRYHEMAERARKGDQFDYGVIDKANAFFNSGSNFPFPLPKAEAAELTNRFNATFSGKAFFEKRILRCPRLAPNELGAMRATEERVLKDMSKVGEVPRPSRTVSVIMQQRFRYVNTAKHFLYGKKDADKIKETPDEPDSDFEDLTVGSVVNDGAGAPPSHPSSPPSQAPEDFNDNPFSGYALHIFDYVNGVLPLEIFRGVVDAEIQGIMDPTDMTSAEWSRVLGVMTEYFNTQRGRDEQRVADRILYHVGLAHLGLSSLSRVEVLAAITQRRDAATAVRASTTEEEQEELEWDSENEDELELEGDFGDELELEGDLEDDLGDELE